MPIISASFAINFVAKNFQKSPNLVTLATNTHRMGRGGGQVVSVLAFYSDDPSSNPAEVYNFSVKIVIEKNENKQKRGRGWPIF